MPALFPAVVHPEPLVGELKYYLLIYLQEFARVAVYIFFLAGCFFKEYRPLDNHRVGIVSVSDDVHGKHRCARSSGKRSGPSRRGNRFPEKFGINAVLAAVLIGYDA